MSHLYRRDDKHVKKESLKLISKDVTLLNDCVGDDVEQKDSIKGKQRSKIETDTDAVDKFQASLYINDTFEAAHYAHSSIIGVKLDQHTAGYLMKKRT
ncbi:unnamed protein product [Rotaria sordida]|uniref:Phosphoglycerate kinase n=1 Tax=Rotaria sordida TaxID=392033 RepID=A0A815AWM7_9BILA|nr:unnamed protein product [Rotaria sordida]